MSYRRRSNRNDSDIGNIFVFMVVLTLLVGLCSNFGDWVLSDFGRPYQMPTPEGGYNGNCHHWTEAANFANQNTCIWGIVIDAVPGGWVWLHYSKRQNPFPDFAVDVDSYGGSSVKFTANNLKAIYVRHCVEVYGKVVIESNTYNNRTVKQPLIHVRSAGQLKFCDDKLTH